MTRIVTERPDIRLRSIREYDLPEYVRQADDYEIWQFMRDEFPHPYTLEHAKRAYRSLWERRPDRYFAICSADRFVGHVHFDRNDDILRKSASLGYWLGRPYWGNGIATAAIRALTNHVFENTDIVRLYARAFARNRGSIRVLEKSGYELDGYFECAIEKEGSLHDQVQYSRIHRRNEHARQRATRDTEREEGPIYESGSQIAIRTTKMISPNQIVRLMRSVGWRRKKNTIEIARVMRRSTVVVSLWDGERLVALANALSDGSHAAYIHYVLVDREYQGRGLGKRMIETLLGALLPAGHVVLVSNEDAVGFFEQCGFVRAQGARAMELRRHSSE